MTTDETYEQLVARLERKHARFIAAEARSAFRSAEGTTEDRHQAAHDAVFDALTGDDEWTDVEAADISDLAYEAATVAEREAREDD